MPSIWTGSEWGLSLGDEAGVAPAAVACPVVDMVGVHCPLLIRIPATTKIMRRSHNPLTEKQVPYFISKLLQGGRFKKWGV